MIITAIALFFSTFSTPMLSAAFTWPVRHRPFQRRLAKFRSVVDSSVPPFGAWPVLAAPNLAQFDVKSQVVHASRCRSDIAMTAAYAALYIGAARRVHGHFLAA
jgi:hypothetical protein